MTTKDILIAARGLIERPDSWCKGHGIIGNNDHKMRCASYAILEATAPNDYRGLPEATKLLEKIIGCSVIYVWNDQPERTHAQVLAAFDKAIAECA